MATCCFKKMLISCLFEMYSTVQQLSIGHMKSKSNDEEIMWSLTPPSVLEVKVH